MSTRYLHINGLSTALTPRASQLSSPVKIEKEKIMRFFVRRSAVFAAAGVAFALASGAAWAATVVTVELWDKGANVAMPTGLVYGGPGVDFSTAPVGIKTSPATVGAGEVTFEVTNTSKQMVHEMIVMYLADPTKPLPYIDADKKVDEDKAGDKGGVSGRNHGRS